MSEGVRRASRLEDTDLGAKVAAAVPFVGHVGLQVQATTASQSARLPADGRLANHIGTHHAGALFTAAETASGLAVVALITRTSVDAVPLVVEASMRYLAAARGLITAVPTSERSDDEVVAELATRGRASLPVGVELRDEADTRVASASFTWLVLAPRDEGEASHDDR